MGDTLWERLEKHCGRNVSILWGKCRNIVGETGGALCASQKIHCGRDGRDMGEIGDTL